MFITALFNSQKLETAHIPIKKKNLWYVHTMEYYSPIFKNELLMHSTTRMNLKMLVLSESRQQEKNTYCNKLK